MKTSIGLLLAVSTLLFAGCCTTPHNTKWEYKTVNTLAEANRFADEGWLVAGFSGYVDTSNSDMVKFLLKRKKQ
jgi:hypothetical protein